MNTPSTPDAPIDRLLVEAQRWYVVQTLAHREFGAAIQLGAQGLRVFLPFIEKSVRHARKTRNVRRAAFPGYLFAAFDVDRDRWRSINGTIGVLRLIMSDSGPLPVPRGVVETLFGYLDESGACRFDRDLVVGQSVRVTSGPLAKAIGRLVRQDARGRVRVLLEILGGQVYTTLERASLEAA